MKKMRKLTSSEITTLIKNGCIADNWQWIDVAEEWDATRVTLTEFHGRVSIGTNTGSLNVDGLLRECGIYHATVANCRIGDNVYISYVGSSIQNYIIEDDVIIKNTSVLVAEQGAQFGNGVSVRVLNEAGGREVTLFNDLNVHIAYFQALYKHDRRFQQKLDQLVAREVKKNRTSQGRIGKGATIYGCGVLRNINVGTGAIMRNVLELDNGTVLSCPEDPAVIGSGVIIKNFIVAEGARVGSGAILENVFVGQGVQIGKQFSAENSLFFANCEGFHSEACSVFAGPYTVTHHKATLLIAGLLSFYNAGSGTNMSNHMYKLGPVHQGILERGCKTGSFSYVLLESHLAPFSVVIGKHMANFNIPDFPFSYISDDHGTSLLTPGKTLFSISTVRDGEKWPTRDRRRCPDRRDHIIFDIFSPYTVEKMRRGRALLASLYEKTPRTEEAVYYGGATIRRLLLRKGIKYYTMAIDRYLIGRIMDRIEKLTGQVKTWKQVQQALVPVARVRHPDRWMDIGGLLAPTSRIDILVNRVKNGKGRGREGLLAGLKRIYTHYRDDEWSYIDYAVNQEYHLALGSLGKPPLLSLVEKWESAAIALHELTMGDSHSEFTDASLIGYGLNQDEKAKSLDFQAVRGTFENNPTVRLMHQEEEQIKNRAGKFKILLDKMV